MATFTSTMSGASADYMKSLWSNPVKTDHMGQTNLLDFSLAAGVAGFVKLQRGAYINLSSTTYPNWFTGYITNDPALTYLGTKGGVPAWGYVYQASGDDFILSLNVLGLVRPFMNVHMGTILKYLVNVLCPGVFTVSGIQDGPLLAQYAVDPTKKFVDVVKDLCKASNYVFFSKNHALSFVPQDDPSYPKITLDGSDKHFTPSRLTLKPSTNPIINDVIVLGQIEPQKFMTEYFLGTGLEGTFPLAASVFGVDTCLLLQDSMSGSSLSSSIWTSNDTLNSLTVANGYLNIGYPNTGAGVYLESVQPISLEGNLRLTHGEWDFIGGSGIICALFKQTPSSGATNCVYGLNVAGTTINPIVNGVVDSSQSFTLDNSKRYIIRTLASFSQMHRLVQPYSYLDATGVVKTNGGQTVNCLANWHTIITEIDPSTGLMTQQANLSNTSVPLDGTAVFATYVPTFSAGMDATVSGITISVPVNASLSVATLAPFVNANFDSWASLWVPNGWTSYENVMQETMWMDGSGSACKFYTWPAEPNNSIFLQQPASGYILPNTKYTLSIRVRRNPSLTAGNLKITLTGTNVDGSLIEGQSNCPGMWLDITTVADAYETHTCTLTTGLNVIPPDLMLMIELLNGSTDQYGGMWIDNMTVTTDFVPKLIGPNEIDSMDGLAPYATITSSNTGAPTVDSIFGMSQFNPGQSQLVFFKNSVNRTSNTPTANQTIQLTYRSAGPAIGRVVSNSSIATEATIWGDNGHRGLIRQDLTPRPRNSYECELAAYAIVSENMYQHYEGSYTQFSAYFTDEPRSGAIFQLINIPGIAPSFAAEQITTVKTTFECERSSPEVFSHEVSFANPDTQLASLMSAIGSSTELFQSSGATATNPEPTDLALIGLNYADSVATPKLVSWGATELNFDVGPVTSAAEVRATDSAWGVPGAGNLITTTTGAFSLPILVPTTGRHRTIFLKQVS